MPLPIEELQKLAPSALIHLFILDTSMFVDGGIEYFHAGTNELEAPVVWQGITYIPWAVAAEGFEKSGRGSLPQPKLRVANYQGIFSAYVRQYQDLIGAIVVRKKTHACYLDGINFPGGVNPTADPDMEYTPEKWFIHRKSFQDNTILEFQLATSFDVSGKKLPGRQVNRNLCGWLSIGGYRGPYCSYAGPPVADLNDDPVSTFAEDKCAGRVVSCKLRFGENAELPYGGFPAAGLIKI
jgi:lambda family phage minor tail protein L